MESVPAQCVGGTDRDSAEDFCRVNEAVFSNATRVFTGGLDVNRSDSTSSITTSPRVNFRLQNTIADRLDVDGADAGFGREVGGIDAASAGGHGDIAHRRGVGQLEGGRAVGREVGVLHCSAFTREGDFDVADATRSTCQEVAVLHGVVIAKVVRGAVHRDVADGAVVVLFDARGHDGQAVGGEIALADAGFTRGIVDVHSDVAKVGAGEVGISDAISCARYVDRDAGDVAGIVGVKVGVEVTEGDTVADGIDRDEADTVVGCEAASSDAGVGDREDRDLADRGGEERLSGRGEVGVELGGRDGNVAIVEDGDVSNRAGGTRLEGAVVDAVTRE